MKVRLAPEAADELEAARAWYEGRRTGLGGAFVDAIDTIFVQVGEAPEIFACLPDASDVRRALVERFPYVVIFLTREGTVHVLAVAHVRQRPGYWGDRDPARESES